MVTPARFLCAYVASLNSLIVFHTPPPPTNCSLCKQNRPSFQDDRPHWKASASGDDSHFDYVHDQNQKNLGGKQSVMYRDKVMTALWETEASYSHSPSYFHSIPWKVPWHHMDVVIAMSPRNSSEGCFQCPCKYLHVTTIGSHNSLWTAFSIKWR